MPRRFDRDLMNMAPARSVARASMTILTGLQDYRSETQVMAAAAVFLNLASVLQVPAQDVFTAITNMMNDKDGKMRPEFAAVRSYMENEI